MTPKRVYVNGRGSVSPQGSHIEDAIFGPAHIYETDVISAIAPNYRDYIPGAGARRMSTGIKMSIVATRLALAQAGLEHVDAVITGTGMGCLRDSEKFLRNMIDDDEQYLTPTSFIQSTHNTVAGQIALILQCKGHNFTYVHGNNSFESALLDSLLLLREDEVSHVLVGGVDELADYTTTFHRANGYIKSDPRASMDLLSSDTAGAVFGEGANFFVLANEQSSSSIAELVGLSLHHRIATDDLAERCRDFLASHGRTIQDIDVLVSGRNGDVDFDPIYDVLEQDDFKETPQVAFKHLAGEWATATSFAFYLALEMIRKNQIPESYHINTVSSKKIDLILVYEQYRGIDHSFLLLERC